MTNNTKGVLTEQELNNAIEQTSPEMGNKLVTALYICLVIGGTNSAASSKTGIHRAKIAKSKEMVLQQWRENVASNKIN